jgi:hypothetical protein
MLRRFSPLGLGASGPELSRAAFSARFMTPESSFRFIACEFR